MPTERACQTSHSNNPSACNAIWTVEKCVYGITLPSPNLPANPCTNSSNPDEAAAVRAAAERLGSWTVANRLALFDMNSTRTNLDSTLKNDVNVFRSRGNEWYTSLQIAVNSPIGPSPTNVKYLADQVVEDNFGPESIEREILVNGNLPNGMALKMFNPSFGWIGVTFAAPVSSSNQFPNIKYDTSNPTHHNHYHLNKFMKPTQ